MGCEWNNEHTIRVDTNSAVCGGLWRQAKKDPKLGIMWLPKGDSEMTRLERKRVGEWESQAARGPERLGSQMGGPDRMPSGCTKHWRE